MTGLLFLFLTLWLLTPVSINTGGIVDMKGGVLVLPRESPVNSSL